MLGPLQTECQPSCQLSLIKMSNQPTQFQQSDKQAHTPAQSTHNTRISARAHPHMDSTTDT